jgi:hypothetical protein
LQVEPGIQLFAALQTAMDSGFIADETGDAPE